MLFLVGLTVFGLALKIFAAHVLSKHWEVAGSRACLIFIAITYAQAVVELYGYFLLANPNGGELLLLKLYFILVLAAILMLPVMIDIVLYQQLRLIRSLICVLVWAYLAAAILGTDLLVAGAERLAQAITRIPGPYYGLIPVIILFTVIYCYFSLIKAFKTSSSEFIRVKAFNLLFGLSFVLFTLCVVTLLMRLGVAITAAGVLPVAIGVFSIILVMQTNPVSLFDFRAITPATEKFKQIFRQSRHIHTVSVDPRHCKDLINDYTDGLIASAEKVFSSQRDIARHIGVSQSTISRRKKLDSK